MTATPVTARGATGMGLRSHARRGSTRRAAPGRAADRADLVASGVDAGLGRPSLRAGADDGAANAHRMDVRPGGGEPLFGHLVSACGQQRLPRHHRIPDRRRVRRRARQPDRMVPSRFRSAGPGHPGAASDPDHRLGSLRRDLLRHPRRVGVLSDRARAPSSPSSSTRRPALPARPSSWCAPPACSESAGTCCCRA